MREDSDRVVPEREKEDGKPLARPVAAVQVALEETGVTYDARLLWSLHTKHTALLKTLRVLFGVAQHPFSNLDSALLTLVCPLPNHHKSRRCNLVTQASPGDYIFDSLGYDVFLHRLATFTIR